MKNKKLKLGLSGALFLPIVVQSTIILGACATDIKRVDAHLLDFNDFHGAAVAYGDPDYPLTPSYKNPGIERIASTVNDFKKENPNTILLAAGDTNSDDAFSSSTHASSVFPLLKELGVRYSAVGNHAFEWGMDYMSREIFDSLARTPETEGHYFLASNILNGREHRSKLIWNYHPEQLAFKQDYTEWKNSRVQWADPYKIIDVAGHPICLIGLTTYGTSTDGNHDVVDGLSFIDYTASIHYSKIYAKEQLGEKRFNEIEGFILLTHVESDYDKLDDETIPIGPAADLAENIDTDIDAIISGHSHKEGCGHVWNRKLRKRVFVGQAGTAGRALLDTHLIFNDAKPKGQRLVKTEMELIKPFIDYGTDVNPEKDPETALKNAKAQLLDIRKKAKLEDENSFFRKTIEEFDNQEKSILQHFNSRLGACESIGESYAPLKDRPSMGHKYIWPAALAPAEPIPIEDIKPEDNFVVDEIGAWTARAQTDGFIDIAKKNELTPPGVSFTFLDSLTNQFDGTPAKALQIKYANMYQLLTHDNSSVYGNLTIGQICNIIDFLLAGEELFIYGADNNPLYKHDPNDDPSDSSYSLYNDPITKEKCILQGDNFQTHYLPGPMQFWGLSFDVVSDKQEILVGTEMKVLRRWKLKYDNGKPCLRICDLSEGSDDKLIDPKTWSTYDELTKFGTVQPKIPVLIDSFIYTGGNGQGTFFEKYFAFNGKAYQYTDLTRDLIINFCNREYAPETFDITKEWAHKLVNFLTE